MKAKIYQILILSILFSLSYSRVILSNLLPDNVVQISNKKYEFVKNLQNNKQIFSINKSHQNKKTYIKNIRHLEKHSNKAILLELTPKNGHSGLLMIGEDQYFCRHQILSKLEPKLITKAKNGKLKYLKILLNAMWVKAKDLKVNDQIRGKYGKVLTITKTQNIKFNKEMDFYQLELKNHNLFYLIDSAGNHIVTHNEIITLILVCSVIGAAIGAPLGVLIGKINSYFNSNENNIPCERNKKKEAAIGAAAGAIAGVAIALCWVYGPIIKPYILKFIENHESVKIALKKIGVTAKWIKDNPGKTLEIAGLIVGTTKDLFTPTNQQTRSPMMSDDGLDDKLNRASNKINRISNILEKNQPKPAVN